MSPHHFRSRYNYADPGAVSRCTLGLEKLAFPQCFNGNYCLMQSCFLGSTASCSSLLHLYLCAWFSCGASCWGASRLASDCSLGLPDFMVVVLPAFVSSAHCIIRLFGFPSLSLIYICFLDCSLAPTSYAGNYLCPFRNVVSQQLITLCFYVQLYI